MTVPVGSYPGGYHIHEFSERLTNQGAEASMVFVGPSLNRFTLLSAFFPQWEFLADPINGQCCANLVNSNAFYPYPDLANMAVVATNTICDAHGKCLWADTFTTEAGSATCTPYQIVCDNAPTIKTRQPLYYGGKTEGDECDAAITINFRRKHHAGWPRFMYPCNGDEDYWRLPIIPDGTFIEVRHNPTTQAVTVPGTGLHFVVDEEYRTKNKVVDNPDYECSDELYPTGPSADWCNEAASPETLANETVGATVFSHEIEVRWSGVPVADWSGIKAREGAVNQTVFLGHPPEAVRLTNYEIEETPFFGCQDLLTVVFHFDVQTAAVDLSDTLILDTEELITRGIFNGRVGIWNRMWSPEPMVIGSNQACTNWVPINNRLENCCHLSNLKLFPTTCFNPIFTIPGCPPPEP